MNIDYDIHGLLSLRLVDPAPSLARVTARQLNPLRPTTLTSEPDVSISHLAAARSRKKRFRLGDAGDGQESEFSGSGFTLRKGGTAVSIPFDSVGASCAIACSRGAGMRRLLVDYVRPALQLSLLPKGAMALHAAAVSHNGKGVLLAGWAESGKTEAMLGFLQAGASFVSDKWTIVDGDGASIHHFPTPITVRHWMIDLIPGLRERLTGSERLRAKAAGLAASALRGDGALSRVPAVGEVKGFADLVGRISVTPGQLFGKTGDGRSQWRRSASAPLHSLFLLITSSDDKILVRPADADEVARRLADCAVYERRTFLGLYQRYRFAFPGRPNPVIEDAREVERGMLSEALASKRVFTVEAPFPFFPAALYEAIQDFC